MGWSTWYGVRCNYDAGVLHTMADRLRDSGLAKLGYNYLNVDDCWATGRDADGRLVADPKRFPGGMSAVAEQVHARGLKFGIYSSAGTTGCQRDLQQSGQRLPIGSRGYERLDALHFAAMGADLLKLDWCGHYPTQDSRSSFETMRDALAATGRPIMLSICEWGTGKPWLWGKGVGQMWRIAMDTINCWSCTTDWGGIGIVQTFDRLAEVAKYGGPGGWNDPDNLMVGNGVLSLDEERAQMSVYAMAAAPLIIAADLRTIRPESLAILMQREVIGINQDPLGKPGFRVRSDDGDELWVRTLHDGRLAVLMFNRSASARKLRVHWSELALPSTTLIGGKEIWSGELIKPVADGLTRMVQPHGVALFLLTVPQDSKTVRPPI